MSASSFANDVAPDAKVASDRTGVPVSVIIAQWGIETGWGTSSLFKQSNNYAGIGGPGGFRSYPTRAAGLSDYINVLGQKAYDAVRGAGDPTKAAAALGASPWDAGHYQEGGGAPGQSILDAIKAQNLTRFDSGSSSGGLSLTNNPVANAAKDLGGLISSPVKSATGAVGDAVSSAGSAIVSGLAKPLLTAVFVTAGLALVVAGGWKAVSPSVKPAVDSAKGAATDAAKIAAVA